MADLSDPVRVPPSIGLGRGRPDPVRVSPLIKLGRWSLLIAGIFYGSYNQTRLAKKEAIIRKEEARKKAIRDAEMAIKKKIEGEKELLELENMFLHS